MKRAKDRWEEAIEARHKRQSRYRRKKGARSSQVTQGDQNGSEGNDAVESDSARGLHDSLHQALQVADFCLRQGEQNRYRSNDVTEHDRCARGKECKGNGSPGILDLVAHE